MTVTDTHPRASGVDPAMARLTAQVAAECGDAAVISGELERRVLAHDASHFLVQPQAVLRPRGAEDVGRIFAAVDRHGLGLTLRSGGTSLSGQAVSDQVLVDVRRHFRELEVLDGGARVRVQPGVTVRQVNARLAPYGRKLGPDPASEAACTIGGVVANNSSGMACGTTLNTYRTLESMVLVLPSGTVVDTAAPDADRLLREREPQLHEGLLRLRRRIVADPESVRSIERLYSMKNTMGYGLNSFVDFEEPVRILEHLMIGSEGTLGFIAQATFRTVPIPRHTATGLLVFPTVVAATSAVPELVASESATVELLDATSLRVAQRSGKAPRAIMELDVEQQAAMLVEYQGETPHEVAELSDRAGGVFAQLGLDRPAQLTSDPAERASLWTVRKGLYATVAGNRPSGANALLEDIAVPVVRLGETCQQLTELFERHDYRDSVIFGHAKDGNVHFMLNEQFEHAGSQQRLERFTEDMVELVLERGGVLKAEHGTGRMMAPFVARQFGPELYEVMVELKQLVDPHARFNPGVIITEDSRAHLRDLKTAPRVEEEVDRCVECGYCEPVCPSRDLTLTPRQRIVGRREIEAARARGDHALAERLEAEFDYPGEQTCAVDGMCVTACPLDINTGDLVRRLRREHHARSADLVWAGLARGWAATVPGGAFALSVARRLPSGLPVTATSLARSVLGADQVPRYSPALPGGGRSREALRSAPAVEPGTAASAVFFPACIGSMFGTVSGDGPSAAEAFLALCARAGVSVRLPEGVSGACCGTPWKSKGLPSGYATMSQRTLELLWRATEGGRLPVVCDASSCAEGLETMKRLAGESSRYSALEFVDAVSFAARRVLLELMVSAPVASVVVHPTCSSVQLGLNDDLLALARAASADPDSVVVPHAWGCCGYAGDRGMLHPELTASATAPEAAEVTGSTYEAYVSLNRTCEQAMTEATGRPYEHVLQLLERVSR